VELRLHGRDLHELFVEAGHALAEFLAGSQTPPADEAYELVQLEADDRDALLAAWLDELCALGEQDLKVFTCFQIEHVDDYTLVAGVRGAEMPGIVPLRPGIRCEIGSAPAPVTGGAGTGALTALVVLTP
jgi:SHS2 domain-containing protein